MAMHSMVRYLPWLATAPGAVLAASWSPWAGLLMLGLFALGCHDCLQKRQAVRRNYPLTGRLRYMLEYIRPELRQYFLEDDEQKLPFSRNQRAMVYARSKQQNDKRGFGSIQDLYANGAEWMTHSMRPTPIDPADLRVTVGAGRCSQPYDISLFNISGMSFGALSGAAIRALNKGAALGGFAHDTGEGSISVHHREHGGEVEERIPLESLDEVVPDEGDDDLDERPGDDAAHAEAGQRGGGAAGRAQRLSKNSQRPRDTFHPP